MASPDSSGRLEQSAVIRREVVLSPIDLKPANREMNHRTHQMMPSYFDDAPDIRDN
jgi:hypothetical protein